MIKSKEITEGCLSKIPDDEPIFVLRARDPVAPTIVRMWSMVAALMGVPAVKTTEARNFAYHMEEWQEKNGSKMPD